MMKNLDDIAKENNIDSVDLGNAVSAIIASRKGSFFEARGYEVLLSRKLTQAEWDVAHEVADDDEKGGETCN